MAIYDEKNKLWICSVQKPCSPTIVSPGKIALDFLSKYGAQIEQINDETGVKLTYHEIRVKSIRAAQNLLKWGIKPGDTFGFMVEHSDYVIPIFIAALCLGCPMAPLHPMLSKDEIKHSLMKTKPSVVFCAASAFDQSYEATKGLPFDVKIFTLDGKVNGFEMVDSLFVETGSENDFVPVTVNKDTDAYAIFSSSGTTGPAKSFSLPYDRCQLLSPSQHEPNSIIYSPDAIYWTAGTAQIVHGIPNGATRIISTAPLQPDTPLKMIEKYGVTILMIATYDLIACLKSDSIATANLTSVKEIFIYGSQTPTELLDQIFRYFPNAKLSSWYGASEIGIVSMTTYHANGIHDEGGQLCGGNILKIIDDDGNRCGPNVCGELCVRKEPPPTFTNYIDDPEGTATLIDSEGFFCTGDIGYISDSKKLSIRDRKKNIFTIFYFDGFVVPFELEEYLIKMVDIAEVCVVGVPIAGGASLPAAVILPKPNVHLNKRDIFDMIADHFPKRLWLRAGVYFVGSLPKTRTGKLLRRNITKMTTKMFEERKLNDPDIRAYVSDIPDAFRKLIWI